MTSYVVRIPQVMCDALSQGPEEPPCMASWNVPQGVTTVLQFRRYLKTEGWHHVSRDRDICPACWSEGFR